VDMKRELETVYIDCGYKTTLEIVYTDCGLEVRIRNCVHWLWIWKDN